MGIQSPWLFKLGCGSMVSLIALGAKYGHKGKLDEDSTILFNKDLGFLLASFVTPGSIAHKVSIIGFIIGSLSFVVPMYYSATVGRNPYVSKSMPIGGIGMLVGWTSLMFC